MYENFANWSETGEQLNESEPAESFLIEYLNSREGVHTMFNKLGFVIEFSKALDENTIIASGRRSDGTTLEITLKKGEHYLSPKEFSEKYGVNNPSQ